MILKICQNPGGELFIGEVSRVLVKRIWPKTGSTHETIRILPDEIELSFFDGKGEYRTERYQAFGKCEDVGYPETEDSPLRTRIFLMNDQGKTVECIF